MKAAILFIIKFFVIFGVLHSLIMVFDLSALEYSIASLVAGVYGLGVEGNAIIVGSQHFSVGSSCTGLVSGIVLASIVFALRKPELGKKIIIFAAGSALLMVLNLFRVAAVLLFAIFYGTLVAEIMHILSWFFVSALVIAVWFLLTKKICRINSFKDFI